MMPPALAERQRFFAGMMTKPSANIHPFRFLVDCERPNSSALASSYRIARYGYVSVWTLPTVSHLHSVTVMASRPMVRSKQHSPISRRRFLSMVFAGFGLALPGGFLL